jgi:hypothetical protein
LAGNETGEQSGEHRETPKAALDLDGKIPKALCIANQEVIAKPAVSLLVTRSHQNGRQGNDIQKPTGHYPMISQRTFISTAILCASWP